MASLNEVKLIGNLTKDVEQRTTTSGLSLAEARIAVNRSYTDKNGNKQEDTTYVDITFWGKQAEVLGQYGQKGKLLYVDGRLKLDSWEDKESGAKRSKLTVVGNNFQFLGSSGDSGSSPQKQNPKQNKTISAAKNAVEEIAEDSDEDGDEIPF